MFGLNMSNEGWSDRTNPRPPRPGEKVEGHALKAKGFHLHGGRKCVIAKSSWCRTINGVRHHEHHIKQDYFESGHVFQTAYVAVPKENLPMVERFRVDYKGTLGVALKAPGAFGIEN